MGAMSLGAGCAWETAAADRAASSAHTHGFTL
jgi:hypothetical protein